MENESGDGIGLLALNIDWVAIGVGALNTVLVVVAAFLAWRVCAKALATMERRSSLSTGVMTPIRLVVRHGITLIAALLLISAYGIPVGNFWTFVSTVLGLVAIGFVAVWSVLSNLSATVFLLGLKPFKVGDYIRITGEDVKGEVIDINLMFTTLKTARGDVFTVPNNQFFQKSIVRPANPDEMEEETASS